VAALYGMAMVWSARMESNLSPKNDARDVLATRIALFAQVLLLIPARRWYNPVY
jgi:hypothetical protein